MQECVSRADIVITTTSSKNALIQSDWIKSGTHIACIGADMPGKQELESELFREAKVFVDSVSQCLERGEVQHAVRERIILENELVELGQVIIGTKKGRERENEITIFDSTGLSIQDIATAKQVVSVLKEKSENISIKLI